MPTNKRPVKLFALVEIDPTNYRIDLWFNITRRAEVEDLLRNLRTVADHAGGATHESFVPRAAWAPARYVESEESTMPSLPDVRGTATSVLMKNHARFYHVAYAINEELRSSGVDILQSIGGEADESGERIASVFAAKHNLGPGEESLIRGIVLMHRAVQRSAANQREDLKALTHAQRVWRSRDTLPLVDRLHHEIERRPLFYLTPWCQRVEVNAKHRTLPKSLRALTALCTSETFRAMRRRNRIELAQELMASVSRKKGIADETTIKLITHGRSLCGGGEPLKANLRTYRRAVADLAQELESAHEK